MRRASAKKPPAGSSGRGWTIAWPRWLKLIGPGLITGASDDDPSGIATYSQAGAQFGYSMLWTMVFSYPLMSAIQEISARIGRVTGTGIGGNLRRMYPTWLTVPIALAVFVANTVNIGADVAAMGSALGIVADGSAVVYTVVIVLTCLALEIGLSYERYARMLKWLTTILFAYVATAFVVKIPWGTAFRKMVLPDVSLRGEYLTTFVAVLGTTISPYLFFWQASLEAEEVRSDDDKRPLRQDGRGASRETHRIRLDTLVGMGFSNLIGLFIMLTCAATLHAQGVTEIVSASQAAEALRPLAGGAAFVLFSVGIVGTGFLAVPVLAGSAAYAVSGVAGWHSSLDDKVGRAPAFYATLGAATILGLAINFAPVNPIKALYWSAVLNGIVSAPLMAMTILLASSRRVMGDLVVPLWLRVVGWSSTAIMFVAVVAMLVSFVGGS